MIRLDGRNQYEIWHYSPTVLKLYEERAKAIAVEMTCAAQAASLLEEISEAGETLIDIGCGTGYFFHSLLKRKMYLEYWGLDACEEFISLGKTILPDFGLSSDRLIFGRLEDLNSRVDHILCMNVLSNLDNIHRPLERFLRLARKSVILRESIAEQSNYNYVVDKYLNSPQPLRVHVNTYSMSEIDRLGGELGYSSRYVQDWRTKGELELVIDYPHHWKFVVFRPDSKGD